MPLEGMDFGDENSRQEDEASGWIVAHSRKKQRQDFTPGDSPGPSAGTRSAHPKGPIKKLIAASRLPRLPKDHYRVVVRPKGGLDVRKVSRIKVTQALVMAACLGPPQAEEDIVCANDIQNIFVISTPHARNAEAYAKVKQVRVGETLHEVSTYVTPPGDTCRGVVRGIDPELSDDRLGELFVHARNPKVLGVRRIKQTPTVIVLFDGMKVPNYVMCGTNMIRCTLYRRQIDACRTCGKPGAPLGRLSYSYGHHLPGLWGLIAPLRITRASRSAPSVEERIRRRIGPAKAGIRSPTSFGVEGDDAEELTSSVGSSCHSKLPGLDSTRGGEPNTSGRGAGHRSRSKDRSASCVRIQQEPTWAERVGQKRESRTIEQRQLPEQATARIQQLERENATLRSELREIKALVEELRQRERTPEVAVNVQQTETQPTRGVKRKAADPPVDLEKEFSDFKEEITGVVREIKEAIAVLPLGLFNISIPTSVKEGMFHIPRIGPRLSKCLFEATFGTSALNAFSIPWTETTSKQFESTSRCLKKHYSPQEKVMTTGHRIEENSALVIAYEAYQSLLYTKQYLHRDYGVGNLDNVTSEQLFFVYYALNYCTSQDSTNEAKRVIMRDRVNVPLKNSYEFASAFSCKQDAPMNPSNKCSFWD
ncbi:hypothetical protein MTO96_015132 [Rhipicephalus appendiculatus]